MLLGCSYWAIPIPEASTSSPLDTVSIHVLGGVGWAGGGACGIMCRVEEDDRRIGLVEMNGT